MDYDFRDWLCKLTDRLFFEQTFSDSNEKMGYRLYTISPELIHRAMVKINSTYDINNQQYNIEILRNKIRVIKYNYRINLDLEYTEETYISRLTEAIKYIYAEEKLS